MDEINETEGRVWEARIDGERFEVTAYNNGEIEIYVKGSDLTADQARWLALRLSQAADYTEGYNK